MEIILSKQCESLTGSLGRGFGYYIKTHKSKNGKPRFFSQRSKHQVPPDGHLRFILTCAKLAQNKLHIADVKVPCEELKSALHEAGYFIAMNYLRLEIYTASDIINLKHTFGL